MAGAGFSSPLTSSQIVPTRGTLALRRTAVPCPLSQFHPSLLGHGDAKSHLLMALVVPRP